ncbi:protein FAM131A isoform X2 [Lates japonicus]|uniref:Protein FAM131A isoform X2 n=1 Tax=Lates japonicus TaxID=270547 RepID=A0AAD3MG31_LATJO|nr:protein FAM131A isoform X2 [Lates japonicus]
MLAPLTPPFSPCRLALTEKGETPQRLHLPGRDRNSCCRRRLLESCPSAVVLNRRTRPFNRSDGRTPLRPRRHSGGLSTEAHCRFASLRFVPEPSGASVDEESDRGFRSVRGAFQWGGGNKLRGWYLQPKHRDATRVAISFLVSTPATDREGRGALDTVEGCAVKRLLAHICDEGTHPDTMVLTALTQFSCKWRLTVRCSGPGARQAPLSDLALGEHATRLARAD